MRTRADRTIMFAVALLAYSSGMLAAEAVAPINQDLFIGKPLVVENITVWPVYSKKEFPKLGDFLPLEQAQSKKLAVVRELGGGAAPAQDAAAAGDSRQRGGEEARVNELAIENSGDKPILILAGTLVKGGKQDRLIAQDFIVPAGKTVSVDAFCVEQGRWAAQREGSDTKGVFEVQKCLTNNGVRFVGQNTIFQKDVWEKVAQENAKAGKSPSSGTYQAVVEETDKEAVALRERLRKSIEQNFTELEKNGEKPLGLAYSVDGQIREVRSFAQPEVFQRYREVLGNTIAIEGELAQRAAHAKKVDVFKGPASHEKIVELVQKIDALKAERAKTKAGNVIVSKRSAFFSNNDCFWNEGDAAPATSNWAAAE